MEPLFFEKSQKELRCVLCPHFCRIGPGQHGFCGIRENLGGNSSLPFWGMLSAVSLDPIEKKPLYHFYPGEKTLSVGFFGCNMECPFCQNYHISRTVKKTTVIPPEEIIDSCIRHKSPILSFTYSEPLVHFEWVYETAKKAKASGLKTVLVTNGLINPEPALFLSEWIDAANIDLKSWNAQTYSSVLKGNLETVKETIRIFSSRHIEITSLIVPGINDKTQDLISICEFLAQINPGIPLHLTAYHPDYKYQKAPLSFEVIRLLVLECRKILRFVYEGNTGNMEDTSCWNCNKKIVQNRGGFGPVIQAKDGKCPAGHSEQYLVC